MRKSQASMRYNSFPAPKSWMSKREQCLRIVREGNRIRSISRCVCNAICRRKSTELLWFGGWIMRRGSGCAILSR